MALTLIYIGFTADEVYEQMGVAEFFYHYKTASILLKRQQQTSAATLIGTVGSFFVKNNEKTIIEQLQEDIDVIRGVTAGNIEAEKEEAKKKVVEKGKNALNNILSGMTKSKGKYKITKGQAPKI
jgi:hypothetical protein